jgi:hypothetical protein
MAVDDPEQKKAEEEASEAEAAGGAPSSAGEGETPEGPGGPERSEAPAEQGGDTRPEAAAPGDVKRQDPAWAVPLYLGGLVAIYVGERVLSGLESGGWVPTVLGIGAVLAATLVRLSPRFRSGGDRGRIENLMAGVSVGGLVALLIYFASTDAGMARLGLDTLPIDERDRVEGIMMVAWVVLLALSVTPMVFAQTALFPMRKAERPESRRVRAAAVAGLSLAMAAVYGALFVFVAEGSNVKADYSYFKTSRPSESTRKIAESIKESIRVTAFFPEVNEVRNEVEGYLRDLAAGIPKLQVDVKDRLMHPKLARELRAMQDGVIVLSKGGSHNPMTIGTDLKTAQAKLKTLDKDFQEQLMKVAVSRRVAYLTAGHGELNDRGAQEGRSSKIVREILRSQNFTVKDLGLAQGLASEVPDDAGVVMVLGPTQPFLSEEIETLQRYADGGGRLLMALDPDGGADEPFAAAAVAPPVEPRGDAGAAEATAAEATASEASKAPEPTVAEGTKSAPAATEDPRMASLDALAGLADLRFSPVVLANERQHIRRRFNASDRVLLPTSSFSSHASVSTLSRNAPRAAIVINGAGSLERAERPKGKIDFAVRSLPGTFGDSNGNFRQDEPAEKSKVFQLAAAVTREIKKGDAPKSETEPKQEDEKKGPEAKEEKGKKGKDAKKQNAGAADEFRAFVIADSDVFADWIMGRAPANPYLFVDAVRWLVGEESFAGEVNTEEDVRIEHTKQEDLAWFYAIIFGAPAVVLGLGLFVSRRSRGKLRAA